MGFTIFLLKKALAHSRAIKLPALHSNGYGNQPVKINTRCSFSFCLKTDLAPESYFEEEICSFQITLVTCVCCSQAVEETLAHLFIHCPFAQACWAATSLVIGMDNPFITLEQLKLQLGKPFFMEVIILISCCMWMERNDLIFRGV